MIFEHSSGIRAIIPATTTPIIPNDFPKREPITTFNTAPTSKKTICLRILFIEFKRIEKQLITPYKSIHRQEAMTTVVQLRHFPDHK